MKIALIKTMMRIKAKINLVAMGIKIPFLWPDLFRKKPVMGKISNLMLNSFF